MIKIGGTLEVHVLSPGVIIASGDAFDWPVQVCDAVIWDPPYEDILHKARKNLRNKVRSDGRPFGGALTFEGVDRFRDELLPRLIKGCGGWIITFCSPEGVAPWAARINASPANYKRALFWHKLGAAPQFNGQCPAFGVECMTSAWAGRGHSTWNGGGRDNHFTHPIVPPMKNLRHETEKPVSLMAELVTLFTHPGQTVFDPVMGTGATGVACIRHNRAFIGIEQNPDYFAVAKARLEQEIAQPHFLETEPAARVIKPSQMRLMDLPKDQRRLLRKPAQRAAEVTT